MKLQPTVWRTCRVLANRKRLRLFRALLNKPGQTVNELADRLGYHRSLASLYLRALNARGLIQPSRQGREVWYRVEADENVPGSALLISALRNAFSGASNPVDHIFRQATALTHPRRVLLMSVLRRAPMDREELARRTGISLPALTRHLNKLARRRWIRTRDGMCYITRSLPPLASVLLRIAVSPS
jgi:DNA-binding MarR family transcriptional regulator